MGKLIIITLFLNWNSWAAEHPALYLNQKFAKTPMKKKNKLQVIFVLPFPIKNEQQVCDFYIYGSCLK